MHNLFCDLLTTFGLQILGSLINKFFQVVSIINRDVFRDNNDDLILYLSKTHSPNMNLDNFDWEYRQTVKPAIFVTAEENDDIVCTQSFLPIELNHKGNTILTAKSENSYLNANYRGTSTFSDCYERGLKLCADNKIELIWGFTALLKVWNKKLGFQTFEKSMTFYRFCLKPVIKTNSLKALALSVLETPKCLKNYFARIKLQAKSKNALSNIMVQDKCPEGQVENLYKEVGIYNLSYSLRMSDDYLKWRLDKNPNINYQYVLSYDEHKALNGYAILSYGVGSEKLGIADFLFKNEEIGSEILSKILTIANKDSNIKELIYWSNNSNSFNLSTVTFLSNTLSNTNRNDGMGLVLKGLNSGEKLNLEDFYINLLWTEGYAF